jgi:hypothetical protein
MKAAQVTVRSDRHDSSSLEVMEGQRSAVVHAQQAAQAKAAHNQAILEGLNAFRGTNKDPAVHGWDEASVTRF